MTNDKPRAMSVRELIDALEACDADAAVVIVDLANYGEQAENSPYVYNVLGEDDYVVLHVQSTEERH